MITFQSVYSNLSTWFKPFAMPLPVRQLWSFSALHCIVQHCSNSLWRGSPVKPPEFALRIFWRITSAFLVVITVYKLHILQSPNQSAAATSSYPPAAQKNPWLLCSAASHQLNFSNRLAITLILPALVFCWGRRLICSIPGFTSATFLVAELLKCTESA